MITLTYFYILLTGLAISATGMAAYALNRKNTTELQLNACDGKNKAERFCL
jgi:hypothetical protein